MSDSPDTNPDGPQVEALLRFISRAERLEAVPRTGWIVCGVVHPESVASHAYMVTLIALWIADRLRHQTDEEVDPELVMRIALFHDLSEALLTDLPGPIKRRIGAEAIAEAEAQAARTLLDEACPGWSTAESRYRTRDCLEARIVKAADRIQMIAKALQYQAQGRGDVRRFLDLGPHDDYGIPLVAEIYAALDRCIETGQWFVADFD